MYKEERSVFDGGCKLDIGPEGCVTGQSCVFAIQFPLDAAAEYSLTHPRPIRLLLLHVCNVCIGFLLARDTKGRPLRSSPCRIKLHAAAIDPIEGREKINRAKPHG
jgi:hypothetical protein